MAEAFMVFLGIYLVLNLIVNIVLFVGSAMIVAGGRADETLEISFLGLLVGFSYTVPVAALGACVWHVLRGSS